jgi:2-polyprenyl-6-hydroxyphenyl methylase/3-demethylubiquinone-9 3-methyltransferase
LSNNLMNKMTFKDGHRLQTSKDNIDSEELARFAAQADLWWEPRGEFRALHEINPVRLAYVRDRVGLQGKRVLDVGCGGGLLAEIMAAEGARVTGIDLVVPALAAAQKHALEGGLCVDYRQSTAENWARDHAEAYDVVTCMELVEHIPDPAGLILALSKLVRPGGDIIFATVNRTWPARLLVIWLSEYVLGLVKKGTHTYHRFVRPQELTRWGRLAGLEVCDLSGLRYLPFIGYAALCKNTAMNYLMHLSKKSSSKKS